MCECIDVCPRLRAPDRRGTIKRDVGLVDTRVVLRSSNPLRDGSSFKYKKVQGIR